MKKLIRKIVASIVSLTSDYACKTYGDVAELSRGPCARCVGVAVHGAPADIQPSGNSGQFREGRTT